VTGGAGDDRLDGHFGQDTLRGGSGNDLLNGGGAEDRIYADGGADTITGGAGSDTLILTALDGANGPSIITDFTVSGDQEDLLRVETPAALSYDSDDISLRARGADLTLILNTASGPVDLVVIQQGVTNGFTLANVALVQT
jgi:Ca2+-binding RTX toxin-like protein